MPKAHGIAALRGGGGGGGHREYLRENTRAGIIGACARFAITGIPFSREFPSVFPGTRRRYLAFSRAVNGFPLRINEFRCQFPRIPSRTAAALITVRPRAFSLPPLPPFPCLSAPPAQPPCAPALPDRTPSRHRAGSTSGARPGSHYPSPSACRATDRRSRVNVRMHVRRAIDDCFTSCARI